MVMQFYGDKEIPLRLDWVNELHQIPIIQNSVCHTPHIKNERKQIQVS